MADGFLIFNERLMLVFFFNIQGQQFFFKTNKMICTKFTAEKYNLV